MFKGLVLVLFILLYSNCYSQNFYSVEKAQKQVRSALKDKNVVLEEIDELMSVSSKTEPFVIYRLFNSELLESGYVVVTQAKGRFDYFDYLVITNQKPEIKKIKVIKYRSEHGSEIASKKWLSQFENYSGGELKYGNNISAISGATFSASAITSDIPKVLKIIENYCKAMFDKQ